MRRLLFMIWKELLELRQDKRMLPIVFVAPILQLVVLGYAATTDVKNVPMVVADADRSSASRDLIQTFDASPYFTVTSVVRSVNEVAPYLESGRAWMALSIPVGLRPERRRRPPDRRPARCRRHRRQLDEHRARVRLEPRGRLRPGPAGRAAARRAGCPPA